MSKARKVRDKWHAKKWFPVHAPQYFGELEIASILCEDSQKLIGRVVETTLYDITGDVTHQSIKLYFMIVGVEGGRAKTILKQHEYSTDYLRSLVRRGSSRIDGIFTVSSKDGYVVRYSVVAFAKGRANSSQARAIRAIMKEVLEERARNLDYSQLCHEVVLGKVASDIYNKAKKIIPLRHMGVRKSKLLAMPTRPFVPEEGAKAEAKAA